MRNRRKFGPAFAVGLLLILLSAWPAFVLLREIALMEYTKSRYSFEWVGGLSALHQGRRVDLLDRADSTGAVEDLRVSAAVKTLVDGKDYSLPHAVEIRPFFRDANRYHHWISLKRLNDSRDGLSRLAVIQRFQTGEGPFRTQEDWRRAQRFRLLLVDASGLREETFSFEERAWPLYRKVLAQAVYPTQIGFFSQRWGWPTLFAPLIYPVLTLLTGFALLVFGLLPSRRGVSGRTHSA